MGLEAQARGEEEAEAEGGRGEGEEEKEQRALAEVQGSKTGATRRRMKNREKEWN